MSFAFFILVLIVSFAYAVENVYDGYKVYDIKAKSEKDLIFLKNLQMEEGVRGSLDFLSLHNNVDEIVKLVVKPDEQKYVENLFKQKGIEYKVTVENIQK